ncbi:hypothetical protein BCV72DRAFT_126814 [Rhizopus microsporus var. microsporus]|uniref:Uncharacterized protein n=1 Tax=Rhizopus microsporus var. microsporus TaxID=86635 RepID=A0A1X0R2H3_RHIZD|nr:hypothetical protein BCV72DRAFT_126814 [Rhizopus microsporus var. microsporus]
MSSNGNHKKHTHARDLLTEEQQHTLRSKVNKIEKLRSGSLVTAIFFFFSVCVYLCLVL